MSRLATSNKHPVSHGIALIREINIEVFVGLIEEINIGLANEELPQMPTRSTGGSTSTQCTPRIPSTTQRAGAQCERP